MELAAADLDEAEAKALSPGYRAALDTYWRHLRDHFGADATLSDLSYESIRGYEAGRRKDGARGQTIREEMGCLKRAWAIAKRRKIVSRDFDEWPKIRSDPPDPQRRGKLVLMANLRAVLPLLPAEVADELTFDVLTGLRREELPEVRANWLRGNILTVPGEASKTGTERKIGLPTQALEVFHRRVEAHGHDAPLFPKRDHRKIIARACAEAKVPRFTYRDLRTTFATVAAVAVDLASVRDAMGHTGVATTNVYLRGTEDGAVQAGNAVQAALVAATKPKRKRGQ